MELKFRARNKKGSFVCLSEEMLFSSFWAKVERDDLIVQQFTGVLDRNQRDIYEGDKVQQFYPKENSKYKFGHPFMVRWVSTKKQNGWNIKSQQDLLIVNVNNYGITKTR